MNIQMGALVGNQPVKMTAIADAMMSKGAAKTGFMELMMGLMEEQPGVEATDEEVSSALLAFLKQSKESDSNNVDASWMQGVLATIWPMLEQANVGEEQVVQLMEMIGDVIGGQDPLMIQHAQTSQTGQPTNQEATVNEFNQTLLRHQMALPMSQDNTKQQVSNVIQQFLVEQGVSEEVIGEVVTKLGLRSFEPVVVKPIESRSLNSVDVPFIQGSSVVVSEVTNTLPTVSLYAMQAMKPVVKAVSVEELQALGLEKEGNEFLTKTEESIALDATKVDVFQTMLPAAQQVVENQLELVGDEAMRMDVIDQVQQKIISSLDESKSEFVMQLRPEGLGEITVKMVMDAGGKVVVNIQTQSIEVRNMISQEMNQLKEVLRPFNTEVGEISSLVTNDGYFQQSGYQHGQHTQQPLRPSQYGYDYFQEEVSGSELQGVEVAVQRGRLYTYA